MAECWCRGMDKTCPVCGGTGVKPSCVCGGLKIVIELADDQKGDEDGHYTHRRCPQCGFSNTQAVAKDYGLPQGSQNSTFELMTRKYPEINAAADVMISCLMNKRGWVVMTTHSGPGKTYLLLAAAWRALQLKLEAKFLLYTRMVTEFQDSMFRHDPARPPGPIYSAYMLALTSVPVLCLDEFAEGNHTAWRDGVIRELLVYRSDPTWLPTFFATNKTLDEIKKIMPWLYSRFYADECHRFTFSDVPDLRGRVTVNVS